MAGVEQVELATRVHQPGRIRYGTKVPGPHSLLERVQDELAARQGPLRHPRIRRRRRR